MQLSLGRSVLLCLLLLSALGGMAATAQAVTFTPAGINVSGEANRPELRYGGTTTLCNKGELTGTTSNPASARFSAHWSFRENCNQFGQPASIECRGELTFEVTTADGRGGGTGVLTLDANYSCSLVIRGVCSYTFGGGLSRLRGWNYTPGSGGGDGTLNVRVAGLSAREDPPGSIICPNEDRNAVFSISYRTRPGTVTITA